MIVKYGIKDFERNIGFNIFIMILIALTFAACIFASSSIYQKLKYYYIFADVLDGSGEYVTVKSPQSSSSLLYPFDVSDRTGFSDFSPYYKEVSALYQLLDSDGSHSFAPNAQSVAYSGRLIYNFEPMMDEGKWLADVKQKNRLLHAVISPNDFGVKSGDVIKQSIDTREGTKEFDVEIIGVFRDGAKFFGISPLTIQDDGEHSKQQHNSTFKSTLMVEDLFKNYYKESFNAPLLIYNYDELEQYGVGPIIHTDVLVPFKDGLTDEQTQQAEIDLLKFSDSKISFADIRTATVNDVKKQVMILVPIVAGQLILTMISVLSLTAISTHKQLKNYGVLYLCGGRWRQCALINSVTVFIDVIFSAALACIGMTALSISGKLQTTIVRFTVTEFLICLAVAVFVMIVSLIMPFAIIGKTQPKDILKEEE